MKKKLVEALLQPVIKRNTSMWIYTDIIELSAVGTIQGPFLGYVPIQSKFDELGYWNFTPPYDIKVKEHSITNITIKICTDTGENFRLLMERSPVASTLAAGHFWFRPI